MDFLDDVRPPDKPYSDVLCNTYINENIDEDLKNALEASIEFETQKQIKEFDKNKKINLLSGLDKIYNIYKFENKDEDLFFIECLQNSIQSYLDEKIKHIELFKAHYLKFNEVLETYYTKHIEYKRKPKINEELYIFLKKKIKSI
jgi:hypothetical protein